jgi:hypothetical protein
VVGRDDCSIATPGAWCSCWEFPEWRPHPLGFQDWVVGGVRHKSKGEEESHSPHIRGPQAGYLRLTWAPHPGTKEQKPLCYKETVSSRAGVGSFLLQQKQRQEVAATQAISSPSLNKDPPLTPSHLTSPYLTLGLSPRLLTSGLEVNISGPSQTWENLIKAMVLLIWSMHTSDILCSCGGH